MFFVSWEFLKTNRRTFPICSVLRLLLDFNKNSDSLIINNITLICVLQTPAIHICNADDDVKFRVQLQQKMAAISQKQGNGYHPCNPCENWSLPHSPVGSRSPLPCFGSPRSSRNSFNFSPGYRCLDRPLDFMPSTINRSHEHKLYSPTLDDNNFYNSPDEMPVIGTARRPSITISRASSDRGEEAGFPLEYLIKYAKAMDNKDDCDNQEDLDSTLPSQIIEDDPVESIEQTEAYICDDSKQSLNHIDTRQESDSELLPLMNPMEESVVCKSQVQHDMTDIVHSGCEEAVPVSSEDEVTAVDVPLPDQIHSSIVLEQDLATCLPGSGHCDLSDSIRLMGQAGSSQECGSVGSSDCSPSSCSGGSFPDSPQATGCWCCRQSSISSSSNSQRKPDQYSCLPGRTTSPNTTQQAKPTTTSKSTKKDGRDPEEPLLPKNSDKRIHGCSNNTQEPEGCVNPQMETSFTSGGCCPQECEDIKPDCATSDELTQPTNNIARLCVDTNSDRNRQSKNGQPDRGRRPRGRSCAGLPCTDGKHCDNIWNNIDVKKIKENGRLVIYFKSRPRSLSPGYRVHPKSRTNPSSPLLDRTFHTPSSLTLKVSDGGYLFQHQHLNKLSLV